MQKQDQQNPGKKRWQCLYSQIPASNGNLRIRQWHANFLLAGNPDSWFCVYLYVYFFNISINQSKIALLREGRVLTVRACQGTYCQNACHSDEFEIPLSQVLKIISEKAHIFLWRSQWLGSKILTLTVKNNQMTKSECFLFIRMVLRSLT